MPHSNTLATSDCLGLPQADCNPPLSQNNRSNTSEIIVEYASTPTHVIPELATNHSLRLPYLDQINEAHSKPSNCVQDSRWDHDQLLFIRAACELITLPAFAQVPPFPCSGQAHATLHSLLGPPTLFAFGGLFEGTQQNNTFAVACNSTLPTPHLQIDIFRTRGHTPSARLLSLMAAANCQLILWGGEITSTTSIDDSNLLYILSTTSHSWHRYPTSGPSPSGTSKSLATCFQDFFYVFGGRTSDGVINSHLWRVKIDTGQLLRYTPQIQSELTHLALMTSTLSLLNNIWVYTFATTKWKKKICTESPPALHTNHLSTLVDNKLVVAGGYDINGALFADIHVLDLAESRWYLLSDNICPIQNQGQLLGTWQNQIFFFGGHARTRGQLSKLCCSPAQTTKPLVQSTFAMGINCLSGDEYPKRENGFLPNSEFCTIGPHNYHQLPTINQYPSMNHTEYGEPYTSSDFASFLTFTMYVFHNTPHVNNDVNDWTLVGRIPIFNPKNSKNPQILADEGFDMIGDHKSTVTKPFLVFPSLIITLDWDSCVK
ncbi:hypothetical protein PCASD_24663 [Puccinia coronata f. sp. avenae]|uniref:Tet-like 2OG-Fe(II) oxygenase domain-containing protein n=1 Tax=Puccinia coronata f. sp. avenae TaxID=200324 RepID=A0A2N5TMA1_9BASI|nr:hypothetical protein PCASD_24663 [Puccinia coronata f. sp. avenae]